MKRKFIRIELGCDYEVRFTYWSHGICRFIKTTKCGYNFLNLETSKCVFNRHLYPSKYDNHKSGDWFCVNNDMNINKINKK